MPVSSWCIVLAAAVEGGAHLGDRGRGRRTPRPARRAGDTLATFDVAWRLEVGGRLDDVGRADHPPDPPAGHGVGLGHAVEHDAACRRSSGTSAGIERELVVAVGEVLVDLVGDHPDAVLDGPAPDRLDLVRAGTRRRSGSTATRTAAPWCGR